MSFYSFMVTIYGVPQQIVTWRINEVELPYGPSAIKVNGGINKEAMAQAEEEPILIVEGLAGTTLTLNGTIYDTTKTDPQIWTDIITPLLELRGQEVTLICPIAGLNGNYLLENFEPSRSQPQPIYEYTMRLSKASLTVVLEADD